MMHSMDLADTSAGTYNTPQHKDLAAKMISIDFSEYPKALVNKVT